jgi:hypothetical protein
MAVDLYFYNGTNQIFDTTASIADMIIQNFKLVPPGAQAHLTLPTQAAATAVAAHHEVYSAVDYTKLPASLVNASVPATAKVVHHSAPVVIAGKTPPIV